MAKETKTKYGNEAKSDGKGVRKFYVRSIPYGRTVKKVNAKKGK